MNKLVTRDWMKSFGTIDHQVIHASERYFEVATEVAEPHLATGSSWTIGMPGFTLDNVIIRPENKLVITHIAEKENAQSVFVLSGQTDSNFDFGNKLTIMQTSRHAFQYSPAYEAEHRILTNHFHALSIDINPDFFKSLIAPNTGEMDYLLKCFEKRESFQSIQLLQPRMLEIINYIIHCPFKGTTRYLFIESKVMELLALQIDQFTPKPAKETMLRLDKEKLLLVRAYIENNYLEPLSLAVLCKSFSLNEFKLKKGYKALFNTTVFGHIANLRMERARQLLSQGMSVSAIADFIGYKNIGSFSAEFKKRFGYAPSKFQ